MSHLLSISIGPVQDFIAAARRTADLYAGSQILQEVCRAAASVIPKDGLIFPADDKANGANKILAEVEGDPKALAEGAKKAAQEKLEHLWKKTIESLPESYQSQIDQARAKEQLGSFLEFYAAWVPLNGDYPQARQAVERLLAGRKALRDFAPTQQNDEGIPKSPLDPARATVLELPRDTNGKPILKVPDLFVKDLKLRFNHSEFLDAISLLKRLYGTQELLGKVPQTKTLARMAKDPLATNAENIQEDLDDRQQPLDFPYYAILVADGDRMGEHLSKLKTKEKHQEFSKKLSTFAQSVQGEIERIVYEGKTPEKPHPYRFCVYSGGDDVLAFLPVNKAIACAKELAKLFSKVGCTLSVGIAIVHYREPLSISLHNAREAEKAAKNKSGSKAEQGNRLAVALHTRGGAPITVVRSWEELKDSKLDWDSLIQTYQSKKVSRGLAYEFHKLAIEWPKEMESQYIEYLSAEARRILARKELGELELPHFSNAKELETYANQLIIARFLSGVSDHNQPEVANA
jgi:CRISPR-associated protein Cmr2